MDDNKEKEIKDDNENVYIPEQLDDDDFEKEKEEAKKLKKDKKAKKQKEKQNRKGMISDDESGAIIGEVIKYDEDGNEINVSPKSKIKFVITVAIIAIAAIAIGIFADYKLNGKSIFDTSKPEDVVNDFSTYFNNKKWNELLDIIDFKGYYILTAKLQETEYTKFDSNYENFEETEEYLEYMDNIKYYSDKKNEIFDEFIKDESIKIKEIKGVTKIQDTKDLYKIKVEFELEQEGENMTQTESVYVAKIDGEYKLVGGYLPSLVYSLFYVAYYYGY